jgi:hypothetical protein
MAHAATADRLWTEIWHGVLDRMVRIASRQWTAAQTEHLTELIDAGTAASGRYAKTFRDCHSSQSVRRPTLHGVVFAILCLLSAEHPDVPCWR